MHFGNCHRFSAIEHSWCSWIDRMLLHCQSYSNLRLQKVMSASICRSWYRWYRLPFHSLCTTNDQIEGTTRSKLHKTFSKKKKTNTRFECWMMNASKNVCSFLRGPTQTEKLCHDENKLTIIIAKINLHLHHPQCVIAVAVVTLHNSGALVSTTFTFSRAH